MSAKDGARIARKPYCASAQGACSREEPQPKFSPASRSVAPAAFGAFSSKAGSGEPSGRYRQSKNSAGPKPRALDSLEELLGNDLIGVHVRARERRDAAGVDDEWFHGHLALSRRAECRHNFKSTT